jgi:hypothetical protein
MQSDKKPQIDVRRFIEHFGGSAEMRRLWEKCGLVLTKGTQDKWVMRKAVPTSRILEALQVSRSRRKAFDFNSFVKTTRGDKK